MKAASFTFCCPACGQHIAASPSDVGANANCPSCNAELVVPDQTVKEPLSHREIHVRRRNPLLILLVTVSALIVVAVTALVLHVSAKPDGRNAKSQPIPESQIQDHEPTKQTEAKSKSETNQGLAPDATAESLTGGKPNPAEPSAIEGASQPVSKKESASTLSAKNPFVIKTVGYKDGAITIILLVHRSIIDVEITDFTPFEVKIDGLDLSPRLFDYRDPKKPEAEQSLLIVCFATKPGLEPPDEALLHKTKVFLKGAWYEYKNGE